MSKIRVKRLLSDPGNLRLADLQVLLQAMRLICTSAPEIRDRCYRNVGGAIRKLEQSALFSTNFLAAYTLLALYEVGQGLYPAAYLSVGSAARIFQMLGLHDRWRATQILPCPSKQKDGLVDVALP